MKAIEKNTKLLKKGSTTMYYNNRKIVNTINNGLEKAMQGALDREASVSKIINIIQKLTISIYIEY